MVCTRCIAVESSTTMSVSDFTVSNALIAPATVLAVLSAYLLIRYVTGRNRSVVGLVAHAAISRLGYVFDLSLLIARNAAYSARAYIVSRDRYVRLVPVAKGPAECGRPVSGQVNIVDMRTSWRARFKVLTRGLYAPDAGTVARSVARAESEIAYAELITESPGYGQRVDDITALIGHLPMSLAVAPSDVCALVLGVETARECETCRVEVNTYEGVYRFERYEVVSIDVVVRPLNIP